jgi:hypothetical protein
MKIRTNDMRCFYKRICLGVAVLGSLAVAVPARADLFLPWSSTLSFDGVVDEYKDNSRAQIFDADVNGVASDGDIIYGVLRIGDKINPVAEGGQFATNQQLIAVFSFKISGSPAVGTPFSLVPVKTTDANSAYSIWGGLNSGSADPQLQALQSTTEWDKTSIAIMEKVSANNPTLQNDPSATVLGDIVGDDSNAATINGYTVDMLLGIDTLTDFMEASLNSISYATLIGATSPTPLGNEAGGLSVLYQSIGAKDFLPVSITHLDLSTTTSHDLTFSANVLGFDNSGSTDWATQDNANFRINPTGVPETASVIAWGLLGSVVSAGSLWRRRRK